MINIIISILGFLMIGGYLSTLVKALNKTHEVYVEGIKQLQKGLETIGEMALADEQDRKLRKIEETLHPKPLSILAKADFPEPTSAPVPEGFRRIYSMGYVNRFTFSTQLIMAESQTYADARKKSEGFMVAHGEKPKDWILHIASSLELQETVKETVRDPNTKDFINALRYSKDHFATTVVEKSSLEKIIGRIENKYAKKS